MVEYLHRYYVNDHSQINGDHEVHQESCFWLALAESKTYLGTFSHCQEAVKSAKRLYQQTDGCAYCCPECHKS